MIIILRGVTPKNLKQTVRDSAKLIFCGIRQMENEFSILLSFARKFLVGRLPRLTSYSSFAPRLCPNKRVLHSTRLGVGSEWHVNVMLSDSEASPLKRASSLRLWNERTRITVNGLRQSCRSPLIPRPSRGRKRLFIALSDAFVLKCVKVRCDSQTILVLFVIIVYIWEQCFSWY